MMPRKGLLAVPFLIASASASKWTLVRNGSDTGGWSARCSFGATAQGGEITLIGGGNTKCVSDVWTSKSGGASWQKASADVGWEPRAAFPAVTLNGSIVAMGGCNGGYVRYNDVFASTDSGATWEQRTGGAGWSTRCCHAAAVVNDEILVLGGHDMKDAPSGPGGYKNDVWASTDGGRTWSVRTSEAAWPPRDALATVVTSDGELLMMGGHSANSWHNDVWASADGGRTWTQRTAAAEWTPRSASQSVVLANGDILTMGGWSAAGQLNDVWRSKDGGRTWTEVGNAPWSPRWWFSALVSEGSVYVLGGEDASNQMLSDVWRLDVSDLEQDAAVYSIVPSPGLLCLQGDQAAVVSALKTVQSSPLAALYANTTVKSGSCSDQGFSGGGQRDQCFADLSMYYTPLTLPAYPGCPQDDRGNLYQWETVVTGVLVAHDYNHKQPNGTAASQVCQHHFTPTEVVAVKEPERTPHMSSSVGSHVPDAGLLCNEGPLTGNFTIYDMVGILKNGSLGAIQQVDGVEPVPCSQRGFEISFGNGKPDHCYPPAVLWYRGDLFALYKASWLETGTMQEYDYFYKAPGRGEQIATCDCLPGSEVRKSLPAGYCNTQ